MKSTRFLDYPTCPVLTMIIFSATLLSAAAEVVLLEEDFDGMPRGALGSVVGAHTEYHFLPESAPIGNWAISTFRSEIESQLAWKAFREEGVPALAQTYYFWGNQGIVHFYDARGNIYHDFEPCQHGSMCLPINWNGSDSEFFVLSANVEQGGMFDGWGRRAVRFPNDGHPDMCNAVLEITGDCRDEVVVWDANELWVYTQDDNPKSGRLYKPQRNSLSNYSNYQTTVSFPGWSE